VTSPLAQPFELRAIELRHHRLALASPLATGRATYRRRRLAVVRAEICVAETLAHGYGEIAPLPGWSDEPLETLVAAARRVVCPTTFDGIDALDAVLPELARLRPLRFGLECALLDALCRAARRSLREALAGRRGVAPLDTVPVQLTLGDAPAEEIITELQRARAQGFRCAKLKVGARSLQADRRRIGSVIDADTGMTLRLDANGAWRVSQALDWLAALPPEVVELVEQPVADDAIEELLQRYAGNGPRVAADESCAVPGRAERLLAGSGLGAVVVKPAALGGLLRAEALFEAAGRRDAVVVVSNLMESSVGRRAVAHLAAARPDLPGPHGLATGRWFAEDLAPPDAIADGRLTLPRGDGLGLVPEPP
jgi:o-succinylbenzoate synthase